jgi:UBX domain-containing protein 1/4
MDHILENEGKAVPDLSSVSSSGAASSSTRADDPMDEDDEDADALRSLVGKSAADLEAKVCHDFSPISRLTNLWAA